MVAHIEQNRHRAGSVTGTLSFVYNVLTDIAHNTSVKKGDSENFLVDVINFQSIPSAYQLEVMDDSGTDDEGMGFILERTKLRFSNSLHDQTVVKYLVVKHYLLGMLEAGYDSEEAQLIPESIIDSNDIAQEVTSLVQNGSSYYDIAPFVSTEAESETGGDRQLSILLAHLDALPLSAYGLKKEK